MKAGTGMKQNKKMITIGITGGVGCGKSSILKYIGENYNCRIILADDVGNIVKEPGQPCYYELIKLLGDEILDMNSKSHAIDKAKMGAKIFSDSQLLKKVNAIIHPAVTEYILNQRDIEKEEGNIDFFFIEAALLIECGYREYVDELWYIYADSATRRNRLKASRGYSDAKIDGIMASQLSENEFRSNCDFVVDNNTTLENAYKMIDERLKNK